MDEKLYSLKEVASYFKIHEKTAQNWIKTGKLKGKRVGRRWFFTESQVRAVLKEDEDEADTKET